MYVFSLRDMHVFVRNTSAGVGQVFGGGIREEGIKALLNESCEVVFFFFFSFDATVVLCFSFFSLHAP